MFFSKKIPKQKVKEVFDKAVHIANMAYVTKRFFYDSNLIFEEAVKEADGKIPNLLKQMDIGKHEYYYSPHVMGRWTENTGNKNHDIFHKINKTQGQIAKEILPTVILLMKEAKKIDENITEEFSNEYEELLGLGKRIYKNTLEGKGDYYRPYTPIQHGIFAEHVKRTCRLLADKRKIDLIEENYGLDLIDLIKEDYVPDLNEHIKKARIL